MMTEWAIYDSVQRALDALGASVSLKIRVLNAFLLAREARIFGGAP